MSCVYALSLLNQLSYKTTLQPPHCGPSLNGSCGLTCGLYVASYPIQTFDSNARTLILIIASNNDYP